MHATKYKNDTLIRPVVLQGFTIATPFILVTRH